MNFNPNLGSMDRGLRIISGFLLFTMGVAVMLGTWSWLAVLVGGVLLLTTVFTFCPFYAVLALSTAPKE